MISLKPKLKTISTQWIFRICYLYLFTPLVVFCFGFLKVYISIPIVGIIVFCIWKIWQRQEPSFDLQHSKKDWGWFIVISFLWVLLSGIGGLTFQNYDFAGRNAIFRDLIEYSWPVYYPQLGSESYPDHVFALDYYFGYWLLPALFGKFFGWTAANIALFLYSLLGVGLTTCLISMRIKVGLAKSILLLVFFSGMDVIGAFIFADQFPGFYPSLWPPITHLEWWRPFQFSSFTTQLFWVFNQSVPVWICTGMILNQKNLRSVFLIWSLCFFFAPIPSLGLAVLVAAKVLNRVWMIDSEAIKEHFSTRLRSTFAELLSYENIIAGLLCFGLFILFYKDNLAVSSTVFIPLSADVIIQFTLFSLLEWLPFWAASIRYRKADLAWYLIAPALAISLFITMGGYFIISHRATIPILFLLMLWVGETIFHEKTRTSIMLLLVLLLGAFTPLYEVNRSVYRTIDYYVNHRGSATVEDACSLPQEERKAIPPQPEKDHPNSLVADDWCSIASFDQVRVTDYLADTSSSFFFNYLARK